MHTSLRPDPVTGRSSASRTRLEQLPGWESHPHWGVVTIVATITVLATAGEWPTASRVLFLLVVFGAGANVSTSLLQPAVHLTLLRTLNVVIPPLAGLAVFEVLSIDAGLESLPLPTIAAVVATTSLVSFGTLHAHRLRWNRRPAARIALLGSPQKAQALAEELRLTGNRDYVVAGHIATASDAYRPAAGDDPPTGDEARPLGSLANLGAIVQGRELDLLLMTSDVSRVEFSKSFVQSCSHLPVRVADLSNFCERIFGHVPISEIDAAWFQYIKHPTFRSREPRAKRAFDVVVSLAILIVFAPVLLVLAPLIRRDGGPVLFEQMRIGANGKPFALRKLRSMMVDSSAAWTTQDDPRVTRIGRFLRRSHLDELPQLINVINGEMSLVGPRPEQPAIVETLELAIPFYSRRHLVRPGITGWAQVRGGYAGSMVGSAQKLCYDLYYLKHRSLVLDVLILIETVRTTVRDHQFFSAETAPTLLLSDAFRGVSPAPLADELSREIAAEREAILSSRVADDPQGD